ncbi:DgyrCDS6205 [Dimorphilus gyrociliatus]|uniref:DgyrCDS6205 n=1 Tax=Dimorphilus gyrociliatus TaxID=2664684 RepID=A0A7I8VMK1_9ANNE|nr:DgyrCDS6205 [Dimorphilus gyrociliatus]
MSTQKCEQPSELREMVEASQQDMKTMKENLDRLKNLSESEKGDSAILRSRIEEQSQLIMILKKRSDEDCIRAKTLEKMVDELTEFREGANEDLQREINKYNMLDARFNDLAYNHQELIKFKDEYKRQNNELRKDNERLKEENAKLFSSALSEKDKKIRELSAEIDTLQDKLASMDYHFQKINKELKETTQVYEKETHSLKTENNDLRDKLSKEESFRKELERKLKAAQEQSKLSGSAVKASIEQLEKEKEELMALAMQRGRLVQDKVEEIKRLQHQIVEMEKKVKASKDKFEREAASVNANIQVIKLRDELCRAEETHKDLERNFNAFKEHSKKMLDNEKEINAKLRMLLS